jgi:hypothetical protein
MHGREYSKRILGVNPPMGRASGPLAGPIGARVSRQRTLPPIEAANVPCPGPRRHPARFGLSRTISTPPDPPQTASEFCLPQWGV